MQGWHARLACEDGLSKRLVSLYLIHVLQPCSAPASGFRGLSSPANCCRARTAGGGHLVDNLRLGLGALVLGAVQHEQRLHKEPRGRLADHLAHKVLQPLQRHAACAPAAVLARARGGAAGSRAGSLGQWPEQGSGRGSPRTRTAGGAAGQAAARAATALLPAAAYTCAAVLQPHILYLSIQKLSWLCLVSKTTSLKH